MLNEINGHTLIGSELSDQSVVIDLGAHRGAFAHGIVNAFGCRCYAVEANPVLAAGIPSHPRLSVHNLAIAGANGLVTLHLSNNPEASTILKKSDHASTDVAVEALTLPDFVNLVGVNRIDVVKFDIEGAEIEALDSCSDDFLKAIPQLTIEFHDFLGLTPVDVIARRVARLETLGFFTLKMWRSAWGDTLFVNRHKTNATALQLNYAKWVIANWRRLKSASSRLA